MPRLPAGGRSRPSNMPAGMSSPIYGDSFPAPPDPGAAQYFLSGTSAPLPPSELRFTGTCRGSNIRFLTGRCRTAGQILGWGSYTGHQVFVVLWGAGRSASIAARRINGALHTTYTIVRWQDYDGTQTTVDAHALSYITSPGPWTSCMPGLCYSVVTIADTVLAGIGFPNFEIELSMQSYSLATSAWGADENPVWGLYTYLTQDIYGPELAPSEIDSASWIIAGDWCDGGSTQKRWRAGGVVMASDSMGLIRAFLRSGWCTMSYQAGAWHMLPRKNMPRLYVPPILHPVKSRRRRLGYSRRPQSVQIHFRDADNGWTEASAWARLSAGDRRRLHSESPPLLNAMDVAERDAHAVMNIARQETTRLTLTIDPAVDPDVVDMLPGAFVDVDYFGTGLDMVRARVESLRKEGVIYRMSVLQYDDTAMPSPP